MTAPVPDTARARFAAAAEDGSLALAATRDAVGLGPGIGRARETVGLVRALAKRLERPLALDADGALRVRRASSTCLRAGARPPC